MFKPLGEISQNIVNRLEQQMTAQRYEMIEIAFKSGEITEEQANQKLKEIGCELTQLIVQGWVEDLELASINRKRMDDLGESPDY
jgi:hypothetical protein